MVADDEQDEDEDDDGEHQPAQLRDVIRFWGGTAAGLLELETVNHGEAEAVQQSDDGEQNRVGIGSQESKGYVCCRKSGTKRHANVVNDVLSPSSMTRSTCANAANPSA